jgi:hypothetical protein
MYDENKSSLFIGLDLDLKGVQIAKRNTPVKWSFGSMERFSSWQADRIWP